MKDDLKKLLGDQVLNEDTREALVEAWNAKLVEAREQIEEQVRQEYASRYEHDKSKLVEGIDSFLEENLQREIKELKEERAELRETQTKALARMNKFVRESLKQELEELAEDKRAIAEQKIKLTKATAEAKKIYETKLKEQFALFQKFATSQLREEIEEFAEDKNRIVEQKNVEIQKLREGRANNRKIMQENIKRINDFVRKQLHEELEEFATDKKLLAEKRVELIREFDERFAKAKSDFVKKAAALVENVTQTQLRQELTQLKEDIEEARKNNFGRKLFESFAAEFMSSKLSDGTQAKKLSEQLEETRNQLNKVQKQLSETRRVADVNKKKVQLAEDRANRAQVLSELLGPLPRKDKEIMSNLLESVKTERLRDAYKKYLPSVVENGGVSNSSKRMVLAESKKAKPVALRETSGDRPKQEEPEDFGAEIAELRKLAGA